MNAKDIERQFTYKRLLTYNTKLQGELIVLRQNYSSLQNQQENIIKKEVNIRTKEITKQFNEKLKVKDDIINDKDLQIETLKKKVAKLSSVLNNDASNSGLPTAKTPIGKKKHIPNSRVKSSKSIGGQAGHPKHKLKGFKDDEVTETVTVTPKECPQCHSNNINILNTGISKDETDYDVKLIKRRYNFKDCKCQECNKSFRSKVPNHLKEENQYGTTVESLAVCLNNEIYTPFNKVVKLISGITESEINLSEGYVAKLQKRASANLDKFISDAKTYFPKQNCYGWDDGVIKINTKDAYLRIYCTDQVSLFFAHERRNKESIAKDGILEITPSTTTVMHDHLLYNYNDLFNYKNVECLSHLLRRIKKMKLDVKHKWLDKLKELMSNTNDDRNNLIAGGVNQFDAKYLKQLSNKYDKIIKDGYLENDNDADNYWFAEEITFLKDLSKYKKNYLMWCYDFKLPSTNNNAERNIRPVKSKMKISGHFKNITNAEYYARIRSYIETCKRNGINIIDACKRLMEGTPYSLEDILNHQKND